MAEAVCDEVWPLCRSKIMLSMGAEVDKSPCPVAVRSTCGRHRVQTYTQEAQFEHFQVLVTTAPRSNLRRLIGSIFGPWQQM